MLDELQNIRAVLEKAVELEVPGSGSALLDFKKVHTALMGIEGLDDDLQDWEVSEGIDRG